MEKLKKHNAAQTEFKQEEFMQLLKNKYNLENNYIILIESMIEHFKKENNHTLYMIDYEFIQESNKMIYYYIYKYLDDLFCILSNANIEINIKDLIKNNIIVFE